MRHRIRLEALGVVTAIALATGAAQADEAADTATARSLGIEGVTLADAGKCKEAIEKLERAEKLHHAPTTATRLGECEIETGKLVAGTERLQRVIRERLPANAHPAFVAAVLRAQKTLDATLPRLATLRLSVAAPAGTKPVLAIDDEPVSDAILDTNRRIDPGSHTIVVRADGFLPGTVTQSFADGETKSVTVELVRDPNPKLPAATASVGPTRAHEPSSPSKVPAIVAFGLGAIGLGVGIYAATVVDDKTVTLDAACDSSRVCPTALRGDIDSAKTWATVSTVGFIGGGIGIASGVVLWVLASGGKGSSATGRASVAARLAGADKARGLHVRPVVAPTAVGLSGRF